MIDVAILRNDPQGLSAAMDRRGVVVDVPALVDLDEQRRTVRVRAEELRAKQKESGKAISRLDGDEKSAAIAAAGELADQYKSALAEADALDAQFEALWVVLPNLPDPTSPDGMTEEDAVEIRNWGTPMTVEDALDHVELGERHGFLDIERAAKVSGSRFGYLLGPLVKLEFALVRWAMQVIEDKGGFVPVIPPVLVRKEALFGTGFFPGDSDQVYALADDDLYLVGTSEVSLAAFHGDEIFDEEDLPVRYAGFSTCFRRESGTYGKDTRGIFRVHQFDKLEMFSFCHPDRSAEEHEFLLDCEETLVQSLDIPYRVVDVAVGDLGGSAAKKYDIEAWFPGQGRYREITSTSNTTDYQSRRLKIRYRSDGNNQLLHTLNGTAVAVARWLIAIVENHQQPDGSILVPEVLQPFVGFDRIG